MSARSSLTRYIDHRRAALDAVRLSGSLTLADVPRTAQVVVVDSGVPIEVSIAFSEDAQRRLELSGQARTRLVLACQRCLEPTEQPIDATIGGIIVASDEAAAEVPREAEPILASGETLDLYSLVDDELLLALPMTVQCERPQCRRAYDNQSETVRTDPATDKPNPFAALASLKRDDDDSH